MPVFKYLRAIFGGAFISFAGILFHNAYPPVGFIASLLITFAGVRAIGAITGNQLGMWWALSSWFAVLVIASTMGAGFERLVVGNTTGNLYSVTGSGLAIVAAAIRIK